MLGWYNIANLLGALQIFIMKKILIATFCLGFLLMALHLPVRADEVDDLQKQIDALNKAREQSIAATTPLEGQLTGLKAQLDSIRANLNALTVKINQREADIDAREEKLAEQEVVLEARVRSYYIRSFYTSPFIVILSSQPSGQIFSDLSYQLAATKEDQNVISSVTTQVKDLITEKEKLEKDKAQLASLQVQVDTNAKFLDGEIGKAKKYQADLSSQIAELSAKQQEILASRLASLGIPLYASSGGSCSSDLTNGKDPGFSGGFGMFTYGVPNRVGLSQYGAWGRAKAGQDYSQILQAYYNYDSISGIDQGTKIHVTGNGVDWTGTIEDYVKRIYEVPDSWTDNNSAALKAQAIAARSYAMSYTNNGSSTICPTDQCQVFKTDPKGGNWEAAVNATAGQVMVQGGHPIKAWFSSTHGGYVHSSSDIGWGGTSWTKNAQDTSGSVSSFDDLKSKAYDKDSPWFYCDWGARSQYGGTAWLKSDEMADIVNVILLAQRDSSTKEHLYQTDKSNLAGTDTWDASRVKSELSSRGGSPYSSISSMNVSVDWGSGNTTSVSVNGDAGTQSISGSFFKTYFNLRAPANIQIVGPLYNIERK